MLIGIVGGICAGKNTVAQYLVDHHGFKRLYIEFRGDADNVPVTSSSTALNAADNAANGTVYGSEASVNGSSSHANLNSTARLAHWASLTGSSVGVPFTSLSSSGRASGPAQVEPISFASAADLLAHVTRSWRSRFVTTDVRTEDDLEMLARRPFFLLVSVDAPLTERWCRFLARERSGHAPEASLEDFAALSDRHLYSPSTGLLPLISRATVRLLNTSSSLPHLYATLGKLDLASPSRLRPSWDMYFMALASLAAERSNCMKRRVGCVLVRDRRVLSTGYNGTPRGIRNCSDGGCPRCNSGDNASGVALSTCLCIHAEENALLEAGRERIGMAGAAAVADGGGGGGAVLYCNTCPCLTCSIKIAQVGIREVVYAQGYSMDGDTASVFREAGVRLRQFIPPPNGLIHLEKTDLY